MRKPTPVITSVNNMDKESAVKAISDLNVPTLIHGKICAVRDSPVCSILKKTITATIKESKILPGANREVTDLGNLFPNTAIIKKLIKGNKGISISNDIRFYFLISRSLKNSSNFGMMIISVLRFIALFAGVSLATLG